MLSFGGTDGSNDFGFLAAEDLSLLATIFFYFGFEGLGSQDEGSALDW